MDPVGTAFLLTLVLLKFSPILPSCVAGCSCSSDAFGRSLLCMATPLSRIPENIPPDVRKVRIEKCHLTELPRGSFTGVRALECLWLNFNNITVVHLKSLENLKELVELRLQGNRLRSVPWTAFQDTPDLKILDLKHNRLDVLPEHALRYLGNVTYLDLSFNQLTVISKDVFLNWPLHQKALLAEKRGETATNAVLALHDNPWMCDCRLKGFVHFVQTISPPIILMNSYLTCSSPESRAGKYFHELELNSCTKPEISAPVTNLTVPMGANVTLTCFVQASPSPTILWLYSLKLLRMFDVSVTPISEGKIQSELHIPSAHVADRGTYTCTAINFIGNSSIAISLNVLAPEKSSSISSLSASFPPSATDENVYIDIRISKQTVYGIVLEWYAATENPSETWFTIYFGRYDTAKKEMIYIGPGINSYTVDDLLPATKYEVCITLKNQPPQRGQCIVFITGSDLSQLEQREKLIHIIVIVCAMVLAVPAGMYACTTETRFSCLERCSDACHRKRSVKRTLKRESNKESTFDSLQTNSDVELCQAESKDDNRRRKFSEDKPIKPKSEQRNNAELY